MPYFVLALLETLREYPGEVRNQGEPGKPATVLNNNPKGSCAQVMHRHVMRGCNGLAGQVSNMAECFARYEQTPVRVTQQRAGLHRSRMSTRSCTSTTAPLCR